MSDYLKYHFRFRSMGPVIDTGHIVQGMTKRLMMQELKELVPLLESETERLKEDGADGPTLNKLWEIKEDLAKIAESDE